MPRGPDYLLMPPRLFNRVSTSGPVWAIQIQWPGNIGPALVQYGSFKFDEMASIFNQLVSQLRFPIVVTIVGTIAPGHARYK
jgi:hypothetical protein